MVPDMTRLLPWALGALALAMALNGFTRGELAVAALGFPGLTAAFFFMLLGRLDGLPRARVATLGGQLLSVGGALAMLAALVGASTWVTTAAWWVPLPLAVAACPLLAIAALRLSTVAPRKAAYYGVAVAFGLLATAGTGHLVRVFKGGALPF